MSPTVVADPLGALCSFLEVNLADVLDQVDFPQHGMAPAVFRPDLPQWVDRQMPISAMVLRRAGGYRQFGDSMLPLGDPHIDIVCYGEHLMAAERIATHAIAALKLLVMQSWEGVMLHAANISGGPIPLPDEQTLWPAEWFGIQLVHSEIGA